MYANEIELNQKLAVCLGFVFKSSLRLDHMECIILSMWFFICLPCYFLHVLIIRLWAKQLTTHQHIWKKTYAVVCLCLCIMQLFPEIRSPFAIYNHMHLSTVHHILAPFSDLYVPCNYFWHMFSQHTITRSLCCFYIYLLLPTHFWLI